MVRNELEETQYTDLMELVVVDHAAGERGLLPLRREERLVPLAVAPFAVERRYLDLCKALRRKR